MNKWGCVQKVSDSNMSNILVLSFFRCYLDFDSVCSKRIESITKEISPNGDSRRLRQREAQEWILVHQLLKAGNVSSGLPSSLSNKKVQMVLISLWIESLIHWLNTDSEPAIYWRLLRFVFALDSLKNSFLCILKRFQQKVIKLSNNEI